jgi:hypothetical protein
MSDVSPTRSFGGRSLPRTHPATTDAASDGMGWDGFRNTVLYRVTDPYTAPLGTRTAHSLRAPGVGMLHDCDRCTRPHALA